METDKHVRGGHFKCQFFLKFVECIPKILIEIRCARVGESKKIFFKILNFLRF